MDHGREGRSSYGDSPRELATRQACKLLISYTS